jgi:uncharacterized protein YjiS (DUF1127 family)
MSAITSHGRLVAAHQDAPLASPAKALWQHLSAWFERRTLKARLEHLDDRLLADIGLTRGDIPAVVAGIYRRG